MQSPSLAVPAATADPTRRRGPAATVLAVTVPPVLLAAVGLSHPERLTAGSAEWWTTMHLVLLLVFPLLGVAHWVLLRDVPGPLAWIGRIAALGYIAGYGALDAVNGIAAGTVLERSGAAATTDVPEIAWMLAIGNEIGTLGAWAFLVASVATSLALLRTGGRWAAVGGPVLVLAAVPFLDSHIYWPTGGLATLGIATGLGLLAVARHRGPTPAPGRADPSAAVPSRVAR